MDRRGFMATWIGIALAPLAAAKAITEPRDKLPELEERDYGNDYRHIEVKGPLIMGGWGYDIEGKPNKNGDILPPLPMEGSGYLSDLLRLNEGSMDIIWGPELSDPPKEPNPLQLLDDSVEIQFNEDTGKWERVYDLEPLFVPYVIPNCGHIPPCPKD